jgi:hypothetical protein
VARSRYLVLAPHPFWTDASNSLGSRVTHFVRAGGVRWDFARARRLRFIGLDGAKSSLRDLSSIHPGKLVFHS